MPVKSFQPMLRAADGRWCRRHLRGHNALATEQRDETRQPTRVMWALPVPARRAGTAPHRFCVAQQDRFIDVNEGNLLVDEPSAEGMGVPKLTADALSGIMLCFELGGKRIQVRADNPVPHPVQDCGLSEVAFDQVFSMPAQLAGRRSIAGLCRALQLRQARQYRLESGSKTFTRHNPELGITSLTLFSELEEGSSRGAINRRAEPADVLVDSIGFGQRRYPQQPANSCGLLPLQLQTPVGGSCAGYSQVQRPGPGFQMRTLGFLRLTGFAI